MRAAIGAVGLVVTGLTMAGCKTATTAIDLATQTCSSTLSGAVSATDNCLPDATAFVTAKDSSGYGFSLVDSTTATHVQVAIVWSGTPAVGSYTNTAGSGGMVMATQTSGATWLASTGTGGGAGQPVQGTYDLHYTTIGTGVSSNGGTVYPAAGTLTATLVPLSGTGATGNINVSVTF